MVNMTKTQSLIYMKIIINKYVIHNIIYMNKRITHNINIIYI